MKDLHKFRDSIDRPHVVTRIVDEGDFVRIRFECPSSWSCNHTTYPFALVAHPELSPLRETDLEFSIIAGIAEDVRARCETCRKPIIAARSLSGDHVHLDAFTKVGGRWRHLEGVAFNIGVQYGESGEPLFGHVAHADTCAGKAAVAS